MNTYAFHAELARPSGPTIKNDIQRVDTVLIEAARGLPASTLHEAAGRIGVLPPEIKPVATGMKICGPALTVHSPSGDNLWLHRALYVAKPGDILVVHVSYGFDYGYWGEIMSCAATARGLGGLVIDGCVRDGATLATSSFPVAARGLCMRGTGKDIGARGWINYPLMMGDIVIEAGDLIVGDADGVVAIPRVSARQVIDDSLAREIKEANVMARLREGERTLEIYDF
ncbi:4-carboxy-4-hydroxy-2-oxoadipate aldolase/oxaloacetate decarboxylase [Pigmentiphaga kullae]|uniref:Putative 4-hydroxy-4-methyl-2-oxoglutarate aldolase n=1 Tax=Pigmentiphaga kullae TaxID=151784 RepID=A0A4Q7NN18_9BURK|nr:4-carboxy-4-hydroxy-2-oxoadipate aldolase/oxaloacetate decarboxylase [Pigmentiphaga kullae]RZS86614.1 4-hydroxy-4-methyl-2-oxoglutarate aldolase [Pigmentiphaga kullae]